MDNLSIVILAAGLGTRMKSRKAKVLHEAGGAPLVEHVVEAALEVASPERAVVVVGLQAAKVEAALAGRGLRFVEQTEQLGTAHAINAARPIIEPLGGDVIALYGDCPLLSADTLRRLVEIQRGGDSAATVMTTLLDDPSGYGRILRAPDGTVEGIVEHKAATPGQLAIREINSGTYCFRGELLWKHLGEIGTDNPAKEYYLTDIVEIFRRAGRSVKALMAEDPFELLGINTRVELAQVDRVLRLRKARELMLSGVTIENPDTVAIDRHVRVGMDTVIEPAARLLGRTTIGQGCRIGAGAIIRDSELEDGVTVFPYSYIDSCRLERGAQAGPFARLRMNACVAAEAHVGNFVELKNTQLGSGSKAMHLAYLGDSVIGENANVGAGTITCNYDGTKKHRTIIGDGAFIGSNATLVAPVEIGAGSYVAAGSVVTEPVPPDALALGRARQVVKENWARKRRDAQASK